MKNLTILFALVTFLLFLNTCRNDDEMVGDDELEEIMLLCNSFETAEDFADFPSGPWQMVNDAPLDGGDRSVQVIGGSGGPHVSLFLGPFEDQKLLKFEIFMKTDVDDGGTIDFMEEDNVENSIRFQASGTFWFGQSFSGFTLPENKRLQINMTSGGFIPIATKYDLLKIYELE